MGAAVLDRFDRALKSAGRSIHTRRSYRCDLEAAISSLPPGVVFPAAVAASHLAAFLDASPAPLTTRRRLSALRTFFRWARKERLTDSNPAAELAHVSPGKLERDRLTDDQLAAFLERVRVDGSARDQAMALVLAEAGLQAYELVSLRLADAVIGPELSILQVAGRGRRQRELRIGPESTAALHRWLAQRGRRPGPLFPNYKGQRLTPRSLDRVLRQYETKGIAVTPRILRNTVAARRLSEGTAVADVRRLLGHSEAGVTELHAKAKPRQRVRRPAVVRPPPSP